MDNRIEALAKRRLQWLNALRDGDIDIILHFLMKHVNIVLPEKKFLNNSASIREWLNMIFDQFCPDWTLSQVCRQNRQNFAVEKGILNLVIRSRSTGATIQARFNYVILWRLTKEMEWMVETVALSYKVPPL